MLAANEFPAVSTSPTSAYAVLSIGGARKVKIARHLGATLLLWYVHPWPLRRQRR